MWVPSLHQEDPVEKEMAIHSSVLAQEIDGQRRLLDYSLGSCKRAGHNLVTKQQ